MNVKEAMMWVGLVIAMLAIRVKGEMRRRRCKRRFSDDIAEIKRVGKAATHPAVTRLRQRHRQQGAA